MDKSFACWHSATFNNDGTKVVFTDEWGGGSRPRCRATNPMEWGANAIFDVVDRKLVFRSHYKLPAPQTEQENCVAHNGSLIPIPGRDIMVQTWYQGGLSVFDFTDSEKPFEIAFFDREPADAEHLKSGGYWSTYWYNGHVYGSEIARGMDIFRLLPSDHLSQTRLMPRRRSGWPSSTRRSSRRSSGPPETRKGPGRRMPPRPFVVDVSPLNVDRCRWSSVGEWDETTLHRDEGREGTAVVTETPMWSLPLVRPAAMFRSTDDTEDE